MIRNTLLCSIAIGAIALPAGAATISVLPMDENNRYVNPDNLILDLLRAGELHNTRTERDVRANRDNAQSFRIDVDTVIDKIAINYSALSTTGTITTFEFFRVADADATDLTPVGEIIDTVTFSGSHSAFDGNTNGTLIFDVIDTIATAGDAFAIRFDTDDNGIGHSIKWELLHDTRPSDWVGGRSYEKNTTNNKIYTIGIVEVPEPASLSLLGLGGLALLRRRRNG